MAEAKDVTAFAGKYKEAKRCRAYEAYQHLAAAVSFGSSSGGSNSNGGSTRTDTGSPFDELLQLVRDKLPAAGSPTMRTKLEQLLTAAARGLQHNPSVTPQNLAAWLGLQLDDCLNVEEAARAKAKAAVGAAVSKAPHGAKTGTAAAAAAAAAAARAAGAGRDGDDDDDGDEDAGGANGGDDAAAAAAAHLYLLSHFCLNVLSTSLKKGVLSSRDPDTLLLLDRLLPLLVRGLGSRHMGTVQVQRFFYLCVSSCVHGTTQTHTHTLCCSLLPSLHHHHHQNNNNNTHTSQQLILQHTGISQVLDDAGVSAAAAKPTRHCCQCWQGCCELAEEGP